MLQVVARVQQSLGFKTLNKRHAPKMIMDIFLSITFRNTNIKAHFKNISYCAVVHEGRGCRDVTHCVCIWITHGRAVLRGAALFVMSHPTGLFGHSLICRTLFTFYT
jgi:hypothetical protein